MMIECDFESCGIGMATDGSVCLAAPDDGWEICAFDKQRAGVEKPGFVWKGEYGIKGRRYCVLYNPDQTVGYVHAGNLGSGKPFKYNEKS